ncbi:hypothetical protein Belba_0441 [Belliella baltica DSM 15883]|uniref:Uncharacterized protein n=1 Tax=Belliella baltica (strain DSM 15883 / CIP 108006 / LMG 21964 / BA134) TaxID=866536 RepID=I3Z1I2_BELBD|nr:hypothetical protein Belba_0441 [Belliella baltica DSM 15883]
MRKLFFSLALIGSFGFFANVEADTNSENTSLVIVDCFQRMVICSGEYTVYNCDKNFTSQRCSRYYVQCFNCEPQEEEPES